MIIEKFGPEIAAAIIFLIAAGVIISCITSNKRFDHEYDEAHKKQNNTNDIL